MPLPTSGPGSSPANAFMVNTGNALTWLDSWAISNQVNVLYKTFALIFVLIVLGAIPQTRKFAAWISAAILFILLVQQH